MTTDWKPISTAPKDGTQLLLYGTREHKGERLSQETYPYRMIGLWFEASKHEGWWVSYCMPVTPTHWMPLPEPPQPAPEAQKEDA